MPAAAESFRVRNYIINELRALHTPCEWSQPHVEIVTRAIDTVEQLINRPGIILISVIITASMYNKATCQRDTQSHPGNTLMSDGLAVIFMERPPPSVTLAPSPSYNSIPGISNKSNEDIARVCAVMPWCERRDDIVNGVMI